MLLLAAIVACTNGSELPSQPPVQAHLVVHVDPLARWGGDGCEREGLSECGTPVASSWERRCRNLGWLTDRWIETGRAADLQLGPEMSLSWVGDDTLTEVLVADMVDHGDADGQRPADPEARVRATAAGALDDVGAAVAAGVASIGVHVHSVLPDRSGVWGTAPKGGVGPSPCVAWSGDPLPEAEAAVVEEVAWYGATTADQVATRLGLELTSYTGHLPRSMAGKILLVDDPDALDPATTRTFPDTLRPTGLGSAYSECLLQTVDHPPFELYPAHAMQALAAGDGPPVTPGERVVGSMAEHLDAPSDGAASAAARRIVQLLVNWRYAALTGQGPRPWAWTYHTHLFQLEPGLPDSRDPEARELLTRDGVPLRGDVEAVASLLDELAAGTSWRGARSSGAGVVEWRLPEELESAGSAFSYELSDAPPPTGLDSDVYPYLPLLADRLQGSHLACRGERDGVEVLGFQRCDGGWRWGAPATGYGCLDGEPPDAVYLLVPDAAACLDVPDGALRSGAVDDEVLDAPDWCGGGIEVPVQGLIVEPAAGIGWLADSCGPWGQVWPTPAGGVLRGGLRPPSVARRSSLDGGG